MLSRQEKPSDDNAREARLALGKWLKTLREAQGLSQRDLAAKLDLDYYTFISQLENGRGKIPPSRYRDWAAAFGMDPRSFVTTLLSYYDPVTYDILFGDPR